MRFLRTKIDLTIVSLSASAHEAGAMAAFGRREQGDPRQPLCRMANNSRVDDIDAILFEGGDIRGVRVLHLLLPTLVVW